MSSAFELQEPSSETCQSMAKRIGQQKKEMNVFIMHRHTYAWTEHVPWLPSESVWVDTLSRLQP